MQYNKLAFLIMDYLYVLLIERLKKKQNKMKITTEEINKITSTRGYENLDSIVGEETAELIYKAVNTLKKMESSARILERSLPKGIETKMKRLTKAITKLHPTLAMDNPKHEELYLSLHSLKESVTSR